MGAGVLGLMTMQNEFSTARMRDVWDDRNRLDKMILVERTLAKVQGEMGIIPSNVAKEIQEKIQVEAIDMRRLYLEGARAGHFTSGFVTYLSHLLSEEASEYIHYGATTQDILDTGMVLQLRDAHEIIIENLEKIVKELIEKAEQHKSLLTVSRVHGQHASPTTMGYKIAITLSELERYLARLKELEPFVFTGSLAGVSGTHAGYGQRAGELEEKVCNELELSAPELFWHTQRDRFIEYTHVLALISGAIGKVGQDLFNLSRSEIGEFQEMYQSGRQGSTAIPSLRPPYICEAIVNLAFLTSQEMTLMYQSMSVTHEKDTIGWRNQWVAIPNICMYLSAQLNYFRSLLKAGKFNEEQIQRNVELKDAELVSERLMLELGQKIGKQSAHGVIYKLMNLANVTAVSLADVVKKDEVFLSYFSKEELEDMLAPENYVGLAIDKTEMIVASMREKLVF